MFLLYYNIGERSVWITWIGYVEHKTYIASKISLANKTFILKITETNSDWNKETLRLQKYQGYIEQENTLELMYQFHAKNVFTIVTEARVENYTCHNLYLKCCFGQGLVGDTNI